jgi:hypothetical protein
MAAAGGGRVVEEGGGGRAGGGVVFHFQMRDRSWLFKFSKNDVGLGYFCQDQRYSMLR